mmetsp:Transcript_50611/g.118217  ORF Transcript_50611/g.118217 Transcript_50611/m.118217 type:complete len:886 (+) Transcript_50611:111-2768(+)
MPPKKPTETKRTAEAKAEPAAKKSKTEEPKQAAAESAEEPKEPKEEKAADEEPKEFEEPDAKDDKSPCISESVAFDVPDTTLNVVSTTGGKVLMSLADGGMQYLIAGARANVGLKGGRYMFEVSVVQALTPSDGSSARGRATMPGQLVRLGFSTSPSTLLLGDNQDSVCFDSDGFLIMEGKKKQACTEKFGREQIVALVLNLDSKSPNSNTIALYKEGVRICKPQKLPECLVGKTLYPHVAYRNVSLRVNFGPEAIKKLPFRCRTVQQAAKTHAETPKKSADSKCEVVWPVAFPDEGTFEWLDQWLEKNPSYVELSERKLIEWATKSGLWRGGRGPSQRNSNDKPDFNFGIPCMDDLSAKRLINTVAPLLPRNYIVMEVKSNLVKEEREASLSKFGAEKFKKTCMVVMGEPDKKFKEIAHSKMLEEKTKQAEMEFKRKQFDKTKKKEAEKKRKEMEAKRKELEVEKKRKLDEAEAAKKAAEEPKKEEGDVKMEDGEKPAEDKPAEGSAEPAADEAMPDANKEETPKEEPKKEEEEAKDAPKVEDEEDEVEEEMPPVQLSPEELAMNFRKLPVPDISEAMLTQSFGKFTIPEKSEGFDDIKYIWFDASKSTEYLKTWVLEKKKTAKVEDLVPGEFFKTKVDEWKKTFEEWQKKQQEYKKEKQTKPKEESVEVDPLKVESISDIGGGEPLFASFEFEDWALLSLRVEFCLLVLAYKSDVNDEERVGIFEKNIDFYYQKYYKKTLLPNAYGKADLLELLSLIKDSVLLPEDKVLALVEGIELDNYDLFVKFTESQRRERERRIAAGDETGRLKFVQLSQMMQGVATTGISSIPIVPTPGSRPAGATTPPPPPSGWQAYDKGGKDGKKGKGGDKGGYGYKGGKAGKGWK